MSDLLSHPGEVWARVGDPENQVITLAESKYHVVFVAKPESSGTTHELTTVYAAKNFHVDFYLVKGGESPEQKRLADKIGGIAAEAAHLASEAHR